MSKTSEWSDLGSEMFLRRTMAAARALRLSARVSNLGTGPARSLIHTRAPFVRDLLPASHIEHTTNNPQSPHSAATANFPIISIALSISSAAASCRTRKAGPAPQPFTVLQTKHSRLQSHSSSTNMSNAASNSNVVGVHYRVGKKIGYTIAFSCVCVGLSTDLHTAKAASA